jgi:hypothetical protein
LSSANPHPEVPPTQWHWERVARRIRVPLGFVVAAIYVFELWRRIPEPGAIAWSLSLVLPGLWLRAYAAGYVKKNRELTQTGPYAYTRNPLYLGSILIAAGFAVAARSWVVAIALAGMFLLIYIPVIASEERFLRGMFPEFDGYCRRVPRLVPRLSAAGIPAQSAHDGSEKSEMAEVTSGNFSFALYLRHREYNSAIGATLLYLSLLFLHPALSWLGHALR